MAAVSLVKEFCDETTCSVCLEYFTDPVTTDCGHNFCRVCLIQSWESLDSDAFCPLCRDPVQQRNLKPNRQLANIVEISKKFSLQVAKGAEVARRVCERHQEPLKLFCREDETPICVVCERSKEHKEHEMIPTDEAAEEYKAKMQTQLPSLKKEKEKLVELKVAEEQRKEKCLKQLEMEKQEIESIFELMNKKKSHWLTELAILEEEIKKKQEDIVTGLSKEIFHFSDLIKDVEVKCQQPPSDFLQDIRCTLSRCQEGQVRENLQLSPGLEWSVRSFCLKSSAFKRTIEEAEGSMYQAPNKVNVTLDPFTANPNLFISQDLKNVKYRFENQDLPNNPERFDTLHCVLGRENFTSGRHWWEVTMLPSSLLKIKLFWNRRCESWAVGVARESIRRKGRFNISPDEGVWAVGKISPQTELLAFTAPKRTPLTAQEDSRFKIRVFLDYEEGCVEFFDAFTDNLIFTFSVASFSGEGVRPFFWVQNQVRL